MKIRIPALISIARAIIGVALLSGWLAAPAHFGVATTPV